MTAILLIAGPATGRHHRPARQRPEFALVLSSGVTSATNYGYTLAMLWLLPTGTYAVYSAVASLLLLCGTISAASTPWVVAREVAQSPLGSDRRSAAVTFGLVSVMAQGIAAGLATGLVASHYATGTTVAVVLGSGVAIFVEAAGIGYLQGAQRFALIAMLRVLEVATKVVAGVALVIAGTGATGAVAGFLVGATLVGAVTVVVMRPDLRRTTGALTDRQLWRSARGLLAVQAGVAALAGMDIVVASLTLASRRPLAIYQAAQILGKLPTFVASALSLVLFARLAVGATARLSQDTVGLFVGVCVPIAFCVGSLPPGLRAIMFPSGYGHVTAILPLVAAGGLCIGFVNLATTIFQAAQRYTPAAVVVWAGVALGAPAEYAAVRYGGIADLAWTVIGVGGAVAVVLGALWAARWSVSPFPLLGRVVLATLAAAPLVELRRWEFAWMTWVLLVIAPLITLALWRMNRGPRARDHRPSVLHLGFEDPRQPGAGGGSARTHEINRRIAADVSVTVVCAAYPGCRPRTEDGVRYVHAGWRRGGYAGRLSYFAVLPWVLWRYPCDLVVEDFAAPFSSVAVPWLTARPVVGVVQWLFAAEKSRQYHLPFAAVERVGLHSHRRIIAVSDEIAAEVARRNPRATVTVISNGLDDSAYAQPAAERRDIAFLGRLETAQKGLDLLLQAFSLAAPKIEQHLVIGGDGADRNRLVELASRLGAADRVHFVGRIAREMRAQWLAEFDLVVMPSRYETFGLVAAEALAAGTPVLAFAIPCLRRLVTPEVGVTVAPFDVPAFAAALVALAADGPRRRALGRAGPAAVAGLRWDELAAAQLDVYLSALQAGK